MKYSSVLIFGAFLILLPLENSYAEPKIPSLYDAEKIYNFCKLFPKTQSQEKEWISKSGKLDFLTFDNLQDWREAGICTGYLAAAVDMSVLNREVCFPKGFKLENMVETYNEFYEKNRDKKHLPGLIAAATAIGEKYKCNE